MFLVRGYMSLSIVFLLPSCKKNSGAAIAKGRARAPMQVGTSLGALALRERALRLGENVTRERLQSELRVTDFFSCCEERGDVSVTNLDLQPPPPSPLQNPRSENPRKFCLQSPKIPLATPGSRPIQRSSRVNYLHASYRSS